MKKPYLRTIIASSERDCVLIILFQLYDSKARGVSMTPSTFILEEKLIQY